MQAVDKSLSTHKTALESVSGLVEAQSKSLAAAMARIEQLEAWKVRRASHFADPRLRLNSKGTT